MRSEAVPASRERQRRKMTLVPALMGTALVLGLAYFAAFLSIAFFPVGVPGALEGQTVEPGGEVIAGALITAQSQNGTVNTTSDAMGNFTLTGIPSGKASISISKQNFTTVTFVIYVTPAPADGSLPAIRSQFELSRGTGSETRDFTGTRDAFVGTCFTVLLIGNVLTAVGTISTITRRRYRMAVLGGIGAVLAIGFYMGALLGIVAAILVRGARDEFKDQRGLFAPSGAPSLAGDEEDEGGGEHDHDHDLDDHDLDHGDEGEGEDEEAEDEGPPSEEEPRR